MHVLSHSVVSNALLHGLQPTRLLCPCNFPGKNTGVGCHFLLQRVIPTQGSNPYLLQFSYTTGRFFITEPPAKPPNSNMLRQMKLCITYPNTNLPNSISQKALNIPPRAKTTYNMEYNVGSMKKKIKIQGIQNK